MRRCVIKHLLAIAGVGPYWIVLAGTPACWAGTLVLKNGDRLTGEIQKLEDGHLSLETNYAGLVKIEWGMVDQVSTTRQQVIETKSGLRVTGIVLQSADGLQVLTGDGRTLLALQDVARMTPVEDGFWQRVNGAVDVGYGLTRGNSGTSQSSLSINTSYRTDSYKLELEISSLFSRQTGAPAAGWHTGLVRLDWFLGSRAFTFSLAGLERDERQFLNLRTSLGGGMGWKILSGEQAELSLVGGINFLNEKFRSDSSSVNQPRASTGESMVGLHLERLAISRFRLSAKMQVHPNVVEIGRYRASLESGLRLPLVGHLSWSLRLFDRFDSRPPRQVKRNDYGLISRFGVTF